MSAQRTDELMVDKPDSGVPILCTPLGPGPTTFLTTY